MLTRVYCCLLKRAGAQQRCALFGMWARCFSTFAFFAARIGKRAFIFVFWSERMRNSVAPFLERGALFFCFRFFCRSHWLNARLLLSSGASGCATALRPFWNGGALFFCFRFLDARIAHARLSLPFRSERMRNSVAPFLEWGALFFCFRFFWTLTLLTRVCRCLFVASGCAAGTLGCTF